MGISQGQITAVLGQIWLKFKINQAFMVVRITCINEKDPIKNEVLECSQHYTLVFQMLKGSLLSS